MSNQKSIDQENTLARTHVPDKVYAYSLQVSHSLYELLRCSTDDVVSIEVLEDVAVEKKDGSVKATQVKSVLSENNPISNRAKDLWKTFYNWLLAVNSGELKCENTIFEIFVAADKDGPIASSFNEANDYNQAQEAWKEAKKEFYDHDNQEKNLADSYALYVRNLFTDSNMENVCKIIMKFSLTTIKEKYTTMLYKDFCERTMILEELQKNAFTYMLGWIDEAISTLIENNKAMRIPYNDYKNQVIAITRELNQKHSLIELAPKPSREIVQNEYNNVRRYIEQLDIIDCDYDEKIDAISDYLRASVNRTIWASKGLVSDNSFDIYEEDLIRAWKYEKKITSITEKRSSEIRGKILYLNCIKKEIKLSNLSVPSFFVPGCYHALSDEMVIGWHPDYENKFGGAETSE